MDAHKAANWLVVVDGEISDPAAMDLWDRSGLHAKLDTLDPNWVLWDPHGKWSRASAPAVADFGELRMRARERGATALVVVEGGQLFLDLDAVREGLASFDRGGCDYFTQWEHCRLSVGSGVRAISTSALESMTASSPSECFDWIRQYPSQFKFHYDMDHTVSFEASQLDSRDRAALRAALEAAGTPVVFDQASFLTLATGLEESLRYQPAGEAPRVDERKMPAAYGFESAACSEFPTYVMFDIINICNARCIHCPQSITNDEGKKPDFLADSGQLSFATYQRVIDECAEREINFIRITADGEPLVHKRLFDMVEYARAKGVGPVGLTTNGSLLTKKRAERLLNAGIELVDFSLDAVSRETFEKVRVGLNYDKTHRNVHEFLDLREKLGTSTKVIVSFVKQDENAHEVDEFVAYWTPLVDKVLVRQMISNVGLTDLDELGFPGWDNRWPCAHFFRRVVINHESVLKACPIDWEQKTSVRSIDGTNVHDIWHSEHYWRSRMQHLNDRIPENSACRNCKDWAGTPWNLGYEKVVVELGS